jgi:hypothetical protein
MQAQAAKVSKPTAVIKPKEPKPKKERKPLPPLTGDAQAQLGAIQNAANVLVARFTEARSLTPRYLWAAKSQVTKQIIAAVKSNKPSVEDRKRARLEARLARVQAELAALQQPPRS